MSKATKNAPQRHEPSGRWQLGFLLSVITVVLWSTVPIALSLLRRQMDAITITWYRFVVGTLVLGVLMRARRTLPHLPTLVGGRRLWLVAIAGVGLVANFVIFLHALNYIPPGASQVVMQLAPLFVLLGGVVIFRESFRPVQWIGLALLVIGLLCFFNDRLGDFAGELTGYTYGALLVVLSAAIWASYALAQKQLLSVCSSMGIMLVLYAVGAALLTPLCRPAQIQALSGGQLGVLAYACANALVGYGCFAEALEHWEASRISTVVCTTPLLSLILSHFAHSIWPQQVMSDDLNVLGVGGAILVVAGSMLAALGGRRNADVPD